MNSTRQESGNHLPKGEKKLKEKGGREEDAASIC